MLFNELKVDGYFLEFDSPRAGKLRSVVLSAALPSAESGCRDHQDWLEKAEDLKHRIDDASKMVPWEQRGISPQCGFSSTGLCNKLTRSRI